VLGIAGAAADTVAGMIALAAAFGPLLSSLLALAGRRGVVGSWATSPRAIKGQISRYRGPAGIMGEGLGPAVPREAVETR